MKNMDSNSGRKLTSEEIHNFITGKVSGSRKGEIEMILKSSKEDFETYVSLKEALYLLDSGPKPTLSQAGSILNMVKSKSEIPFIQLSIRVLLNKVLVSSSDQENLEYQGIMTEFAFRGSEPGPISITRKIKGNQITLSFIPTPDSKGYSLEIAVANNSGFSVILLVAGEEWEVIRDLDTKSIFDSVLPLHGNLELKFKKKGEVIFSIGILMYNES